MTYIKCKLKIKQSHNWSIISQLVNCIKRENMNIIFNISSRRESKNVNINIISLYFNYFWLICKRGKPLAWEILLSPNLNIIISCSGKTSVIWTIKYTLVTFKTAIKDYPRQFQCVLRWVIIFLPEMKGIY